MTARATASPSPLERLLPAGLGAFALYHLALGGLMALDAGTFHAEIGPFGPRNDHYTRDVATYNFAIGAVLLVAVRRHAWRVPALVLVTLQFALHTVNHAIDIDEAEPEWVGVADFLGLLLATGLLVALVLAARRAAGLPGGGAR